MLNFRKLKQDFSSNILKEGRLLHEQNKVVSAKILKVDSETIRLHAKILGNFENTYESEIEIDRFQSQTLHSNCDCPYRYDCQHIAALMFFLEDKMDALIIQYSKEAKDLGEKKEELQEVIKVAETKEAAKKDANMQKEILEEYIHAADVFSFTPFFLSPEEGEPSSAELAFLFNPANLGVKGKVEFQLALRLPSRSKPLQVINIKQFVEALRYEEPLYMGGKKYIFSLKSFAEMDQKILKIIMDSVKFQEGASQDRASRSSFMDMETFGSLLAYVHDVAREQKVAPRGFSNDQEEMPVLPCLYYGNLEAPLRYSPMPAHLRFACEYLEAEAPKLFLKPTIVADQVVLPLNDVTLFECAQPGMIYQETYFRFPAHIKRKHLKQLVTIRDMTIPEPLFGTFVENALPELKRYAEVADQEVIEKFVTLPFAKKLDVRCELSYLDGELEATVKFFYDGHEIPAGLQQLEYKDILSFVSENGVLARNLVEERKLIEELFQDFVCNPVTGSYVAKTEKKIVEFMTETVPRLQDKIHFDCPQNLMEQFIYDQTTFELSLDYTDKVGYYTLDLVVNGALKGIKLDVLWECISSKRSFIELDAVRQKTKTKNISSEPRFSKILVLDLEKTTKIIQLFDELGIQKLDTHKEERPLWSLVTMDDGLFQGLPVQFSISKKLLQIRRQMLGEEAFTPKPIPKEIFADLRGYQKEGVHWLQKLRLMYLNGILADDMGLGKTLQAIIAITQYLQEHSKGVSLIVCPTSLLYNWKEELHKFNPKLQTQVIDGVPNVRKKLLGSLKDFDVVITSYTLLQKDIDLYRQIDFAYAVLDEAQHIKNRGTRNARSVKMIQSAHRLILTGTPIENSLDELWSLFDFLMPGFLSSYDRFIEKYIRSSGQQHQENMAYLKKKVSPFILRRMKGDVLQDLPPVSEIVYHCQLSKVQMDLYRSYAESAKNELAKLVERDGFDKVQIHVLATLTRLKQICCHPAILAKEKAEEGDSSKYDMLLELLQTLVESGHKTVIFSQYTKMLQIMREDFEARGIGFNYLDGSSKNRLQIVKEFNENKNVPVFLVSLKAGGTGLNLIGADTVIHYDMWWNPAVENQATDRVHRLGQKNSVSSYKLITLNTIEEKIVEMQKTKKGLVKKVVSCDDEAIQKLTWEDVLELLQI